MPAAVPIAIGFGCGLAVGQLAAQAAWWLAPLCAFLALAAGRRAVHAAMACTAAAAGVLWGVAAETSRAGDCRLAWRDGARLVLHVEPRDLQLTGRLPLHDIRTAPQARGGQPRQNCHGRVRVVAPRGDTLPAAVIVVTGIWRREPAGEARRDPVRAGRLLVEQWSVSPLPLSMRARLRMAAERRLVALFGAERAALATALTVSPESGLTPEQRGPFVRAGIAHLLSISGFHVGVLAAGLVLLLRAARLEPNPARLGGTAMVAAYVWLLGFPAPALRAAALIGLWAAARSRQRPPEWRAVLAVTATVVLAADPGALFRPGPWLSFSGFYGCLVAVRWSSALRLGHERRSPRARAAALVATPLLVSFAASLATAPLTVAAFGTLAPAGLVANLAAGPLAAFGVPALAFALLLGSLPAAAPLAALAAGAAGLCLDLLEWVTLLAGKLPAGFVEIHDRPLAAGAVGLCAIVLVRAPPALPGALARTLGFRASLAALLVASISAWRPAMAAFSGYRDGELSLHFLAVGQGDAIAIRTPGGRWILVDGGPLTPRYDAGARVVEPFLRSRGVRRLDLVVLSHADADHLGGLPAVLRRVPAAAVIEPGEALPRGSYRAWLAALDSGRVLWRAARAGDRIVIDGVTIRVWHPDSAFLARRLPPNENSVVVTVEYGRFRAVLPGDAGIPMELERSAAIGRVTLLKVGHHGSRSSTGADWIEALRPSACVVQVGTNRYGHPVPGVLAALRAAGCALWRTDRDGAVTVATDGRRVTIRSGGRDTSFVLGEEPR
jgi:competence protein ComEC